MFTKIYLIIIIVLSISWLYTFLFNKFGFKIMEKLKEKENLGDGSC